MNVFGIFVSAAELFAVCVVAFVLLIIFRGNSVRIRGALGNIFAGKAKGDVNQHFQSDGGVEPPAATGRDWFDITSLVFAGIGTLSGVGGLILGILKWKEGSP